MAALADRRILGSRGADGRVHAPPFEYDPVTLAPPTELVPVGLCAALDALPCEDTPVAAATSEISHGRRCG